MEKSLWRYVFLFFLLFPCVVYANNVRFYPINLTQPNGTEIHVFISGNEFCNWVHDANDYTIVKDPQTGYFVYAVRAQNGDLAPSYYIVGLSDPAAAGLAKGLKRPWEFVGPQIERLVQMGLNNASIPAPHTGTINNLVVFIRFSDEPEFTDPKSTFDGFFNNAAAGANSMYNYFKEASYNALSVSTSFYPVPPGSTVVSYQDSQPRAYYTPYDALTNPLGYTSDNATAREHTLLKNAVNAIASQVPASLNIDGDGDGKVDNVCFIVSGNMTAWSTLLWPHMWSLYSYTVNINGKRVYTYNFQLRDFLNARGVGVLCHEMCHSLGAPDLYHYTSDGIAPVYSWDIMENDQNPPQHMGAYMKYKYTGWIADLPSITPAPESAGSYAGIYSGTYSLNPLMSSTGNCYKIPSPYSASEFFVVEYRKKTGTFESSIPGTGLLVYRINSAKTGNAQGPPDEVYIYRPNGTLTANGQPQNAHFSADVGRTTINDGTNPSSFLSTGASGGLNISGVGSAGATISFTVGAAIIVAPSLTTSPISAIGTVNACGGGTVLADGGAAVTARGVCWSTAANPTTSNSKTVDGTGIGAFSSAITGLTANTTYHVRAYATNSIGTAYGADLTFKTLSMGYGLPFSENFVASIMPANWTTQNTGSGITERWALSNTTAAGGAAYEAMCLWANVSPGTTRLITPGLNTLGYSSLHLSFKHFLDNYNVGATLKIQTSTNGVTWTDETWALASGTSNVGPATVVTTITHNLNSATTFIAFVVTGNLYMIDAWYLDDISMTGTTIPASGSFDWAGSWTGAGSGTDGWYLGDFDGDGKTDIFRYLPGVSGADVFISNGSSFVSSGSWTGAGNGTDGWYLGDFNGDGKTDIFRYVPGVSGADVFLSNGSSFVSSGSWTGAGSGTDGWYLGDFNGDGKTDIMRYVPGVSGADVFLSNGSSFVYSGSWAGAGSGTEGWYLGDFDGDGKTDIFRYVPGASGADVFLSNGSSFVQDGSWTGAGSGAAGWYIGKFNGDARADIFRYLPGISGADVFFSHAASPIAVPPMDPIMRAETIQRLNALSESEERGLLTAFVEANKKGEHWSILDVKKAYEKKVGLLVTRAFVNRLLNKYGIWEKATGDVPLEKKLRSCMIRNRG